jgi:hypothetical protein
LVGLIARRTDGAGSDSYNQSLSERRAEAVKVFLAQQFKLSRDQLLALGFGRSQLKNAADPLAAENRRVQIVNTGAISDGGSRCGRALAMRAVPEVGKRLMYRIMIDPTYCNGAIHEIRLPHRFHPGDHADGEFFRQCTRDCPAGRGGSAQ